MTICACGTPVPTEAAARRHAAGPRGVAMTDAERSRSGWCTAPAGARPHHEQCRADGCGCECPDDERKGD